MIACVIPTDKAKTTICQQGNRILIEFSNCQNSDLALVYLNYSSSVTVPDEP